MAKVAVRSSQSSLWENIPQPTGWTWTDCPVTPQRSTSDPHVFRAYNATERKVFDVADYAPTGKAYYVDVATGNNGNSGLDWANALQSISVAIGKHDQGVIYVKAGMYPKGYGCDGASWATLYSIIAVGGVAQCSNHYPGLAWIADGSNPGAWQTTVPAAIWSVWDAHVLDAYGNYSKLAAQVSAAGVAGNAGSYYLSGTTLWVRTADDREPDQNIRAYASASGVAYATYIEGLRLEGCVYPAAAAKYAKNCVFGYTGGNALAVSGSDTIFQNCEIVRSYADGFNYHASGGVGCRSIEIGCSSHDTGTGSSDNGSTTHESNKILRIMGTYERSTGPVVIEVGQAIESWNLGCVAKVSSIVGVNYYIVGAEGNPAQMWLDGCTSDDSATDFAVGAGTLSHRNCIWNGVASGATVVSPY